MSSSQSPWGGAWGLGGRSCDFRRLNPSAASVTVGEKRETHVYRTVGRHPPRAGEVFTMPTRRGYPYQSKRRLFTLAALLLLIFASSCGRVGAPSYPNTTLLGKIDGLFPSDLSWSPDGSRIAVTTYSFGSNVSRIHLLDVKTGRSRQVMGSEWGWISATSWSPDGKQLLLVVIEGANELGPGIWVLNLEDGQSPEYISEGYWGTWSPIADELAIIDVLKSEPVWEVSVRLRDLDTSSDREIFGTKARYSLGLTWSPDGGQLAFALSPEEGSAEQYLYFLDLETRKMQQMTHSGIGSTPAWSPNGDLIAYVSEENDGTARLHFLGSDGRCDLIVPQTAGMTHPAWSPDGMYLAFVGQDGGIFRLDVQKALAGNYQGGELACP